MIGKYYALSRFGWQTASLMGGQPRQCGVAPATDAFAVVDEIKCFYVAVDMGKRHIPADSRREAGAIL